MTRTRLPRPGEVVEPCRLCGAALELSVENPRRVCAACGEINLPSDSAPLDLAAAPRHQPAPQRISGLLAWLSSGAPRLGAGAPGLAFLAGLLFTALRWARDFWLEWMFWSALALVPLTLGSLVICAGLAVRSHESKVRVAIDWGVAYLGSLMICGVLAFLCLRAGVRL